MMRLLHVTTERGWRGGENQLCILAAGCKDYTQIIAAPPGALVLTRLPNDVDVFPLRMRNDLDVVAAVQLAKLCKREKIDIAHAHTARAHALLLLAKLLRPGFKLVVHRRVASKGTPNCWTRIKYKSGLIDRWIAISQAAKDGLVESGVEAARVAVIRSAVVGTKATLDERLAARQTLCNTYHMATSRVCLACVAHLSPEKRVDMLLTALSQLPRSVTQQIMCFIVGTGPDRAMLESTSRSLGISDSIRFCGFVNAPREILAGCDIVCLPSAWEGLGTSLLDGILAGCVPVGSNVGGIPEIILDGKTGYLCEDAASLASTLANLVADRACWPTLVDAARRHLEENFSVDMMVQRTRRLYDELAGNS